MVPIFVHPSIQRRRPYNASCIARKKTSKDTYLFGGKSNMDRYGIDTSAWPALPDVQQKVLDPLTIDNQD